MQQASNARIWSIAFCLSLGTSVATGYARFAYGLILPAMKSDLGWTYAQAGWINTANALGYFVGALLTLAAISRIGAKRLYSWGMITTTAALLITAMSRDLNVLSLGRILAGVGGAPVFIAGGTIASGLFRESPTRNAVAISSFYAGGGIGILVSGLMLPPFFSAFGDENWPRAWLLLAALSAGSTVASIFSIRFGGVQPAPQPVYGAERSPMNVWPSLLGYAIFAVGYIIYFTFVVAWMKAREVSMSAVTMTWSAIGIGALLAPLLWRRVLSASSSGYPLALACLATSFATAIPLVWNGAVGFVFSAFLFGTSFFMAPSAVTTFTRKNLAERDWGWCVALHTVLFAAGQTVGPVAAGFAADLSGTLWSGFAFAAIVLLIAAGVSMLQRPLERGF